MYSPDESDGSGGGFGDSRPATQPGGKSSDEEIGALEFVDDSEQVIALEEVPLAKPAKAGETYVAPEYAHPAPRSFGFQEVQTWISGFSVGCLVGALALFVLQFATREPSRQTPLPLHTEQRPQVEVLAFVVPTQPAAESNDGIFVLKPSPQVPAVGLGNLPAESKSLPAQPIRPSDDLFGDTATSDNPFEDSDSGIFQQRPSAANPSVPKSPADDLFGTP